MSSSFYSFKPGGLKLKGSDEKKDKTTKKKKKSKSSTSVDVKNSSSTSHTGSSKVKDANVDNDLKGDDDEPFDLNDQITSSSSEPKMTEAEKKFQEMRKRRMHERIRKEAKLTHKEKVDAFNRYLESLSEHHDLPKVGPG